MNKNRVAFALYPDKVEHHFNLPNERTETYENPIFIDNHSKADGDIFIDGHRVYCIVFAYFLFVKKTKTKTKNDGRTQIVFYE